MSFFKTLFGKSTPLVEDKAFTIDFEDALKRYIGVTDGDVAYEFKDKKGNVIPPSYAFEGAYNQWKEIQSVWDKRGVIFAALDSVYFNRIPKAQVIERFVIDRYPEKALQFAAANLNETDYTDPEVLASLAKCHFILLNFDESIALAQKALEQDGDNKKAKIALADSFHLTGQHEEAHQIYQQLLENSLRNEWKSDEINVLQLVDFKNDIIHSSVYAVALLSVPEADETIWNTVAEEFYYCPYFRSQHAFWSIRSGESLKGVVKLLATAQEFPWYRDAVVNAKSSILQFREQMQSDDLWENELQYLTEIMQKNNWN
ncbi:MAG TPA: tetratricopeptide repeat protein [Flavobacterium sp.]|nr:tetratricopeptide repeat protein [Flavobacterium sp.]